jgi:hypothetical protein
VNTVEKLFAHKSGVQGSKFKVLNLEPEDA